MKIIPLKFLRAWFVSLAGIMAYAALSNGVYGAPTELQNQTENTGLEAVQAYEEQGRYAQALRAARHGLKEAQSNRWSHEAVRYSAAIRRLEEAVLSKGCSALLLDRMHRPRPKLIQLLRLVGCEDPDRDLVKINEWMQRNLLRKGERWQAQSKDFEKLKPCLQPLLNELGVAEAAEPSFDCYRGALVHGALLTSVRRRLHYLVEKWNQGVRFDYLYFLTGERPLDEKVENREALMKGDGRFLKIRKEWQEPSAFPETESEMIQLVWDQSLIPEEMRRQLKVHCIKASMKVDPVKGVLVRPTTEDTVDAWLKALPPPGRYLAITEAPYIVRQDLVIRSRTPAEFEFETAGCGLNETLDTVLILDELARAIFQCAKLYQPGRGEQA